MLIYHTVSAIMINTVSRAMVYNGDTAANVVLPKTQNFKKKNCKNYLASSSMACVYRMVHKGREIEFRFGVGS
jgi:hypothetical protein